MAINKTVNKSTKTHGAMRNCLEYVLRTDKTNEQLVYVTGPYDKEGIDYDQVYRSFLEEKRIWDKDSGRMYAHNIISWHKDEAITSEQAFEFGKEFAENWFQGFQTVVAVHKDKEHIHCHLVTNTVSFEDGRRLHNTRKDLERMKELTNRMCKERDLSVAEKGRHFNGTPMENGTLTAWSKDKYNLIQNEKAKSYLTECAIAFIKAIKGCFSKEEFIRRMEKSGWKVNWSDRRKHITFQNEQGQKVRDSNLSKTFRLDISKEAILNECNRESKRRTEEQYAGAAAEDTTIAAGAYDSSRRVSEKTIGDELLEQARTANRATESLVRESETARRKSKSETSIIRGAENQSIADEQQRRLAQQQRFDAEKRARELNRRSKRRSGPEL